jgi:hypothetical protein
MIKFIIVIAVIIALKKDVELKLRSPSGKLRDIRKNPHVIGAGLELNLQPSY